jgi:hypothetical protein
VNRREVLTGMALTGAAVAIPTAAMSTARPDRRAWDRAFAALQAAQKASDDFDAQFWRIEEAFKAEADKVPHVTIESGGYGRPLTTADQDVVRRARHGSASLRYVEICAYADVKAEQQLADAADARDAQIKAIDDRLGRSTANDHYDKLSEAICDAESVLLKMPAPDGEALLWKVNRLYAPGEGIWEPDYEAQTQADLRRLLSTGRA